MSKIAIVYHSAYGHTARQAEAVAKGARDGGGDVTLFKVDELIEAEAPGWAVLDAADAIIFGSPTYMGSFVGPLRGVQGRDVEAVDDAGVARQDRRRLHQLGRAERRQGQHADELRRAGDAARHDLGRAGPDAGQQLERTARSTISTASACRSARRRSRTSTPAPTSPRPKPTCAPPSISASASPPSRRASPRPRPAPAPCASAAPAASAGGRGNSAIAAAVLAATSGPSIGCRKKWVKARRANRSGERERLRIDQLQLVARRQHQRRGGLRADADPVEAGRRRLRAVGLDRDREAAGVERVDQRGVELEQRLAAGADDEAVVGVGAPRRGDRRGEASRHRRTCRRRGRRCRRNRCRRSCRPRPRGRPRARSTGCTRRSAGTPRAARSARPRPAA